MAKFTICFIVLMALLPLLNYSQESSFEKEKLIVVESEKEFVSAEVYKFSYFENFNQSYCAKELGKHSGIRLPEKELPGLFVIQFKLQNEISGKEYCLVRKFYIGFDDKNLRVKLNKDEQVELINCKEDKVFKQFVSKANKRINKIRINELALAEKIKQNLQDNSIDIKKYSRKIEKYNDWVFKNRQRNQDKYISKFMFLYQYHCDIENTEVLQDLSVVNTFYDHLNFISHCDPQILVGEEFAQQLESYMEKEMRYAEENPDVKLSVLFNESILNLSKGLDNGASSVRNWLMRYRIYNAQVYAYELMDQ
ncbi:hypothetical protein [Marinifilum sp.]|uniref:hypothetical protein n=1 Tax=Marinifilum sp. TaxID=2033137 RepID=UPI003BA8E591